MTSEKLRVRARIVGTALTGFAVLACTPWVSPSASDGEEATAFVLTLRRAWFTDGTPEGTVDLGLDNANVIDGERVGEVLLFGNRSELWRSDGTPEGTRMVKDVHHGRRTWISLFDSALSPQDIVRVGDEVFFRYGDVLWRSNGTSEGTRIVWQRLGRMGSDLCCVVAAGGLVYFFAKDDEHPILTPRILDPRSGEVRAVEGVESVDTHPNFHVPIAFRNSMVFVGRDGSKRGVEPMITSSGRAKLLANIHPDEGRLDPGNSSPSGVTVLGDRLYFLANDGTHGSEPWVSDGSEAGTTMLIDLAPGLPGVQNFSGFGGDDRFAYFAAVPGDYTRSPTDRVVLYRSEGTPETTVEVTPLPGFRREGYGMKRPRRFVGVTDRIFFTYDDQVHGTELWTSDGTADGTRMVADLTKGTRGEGPKALTPLGAHRIVFVLDHALWVSDGTTEGTRSLSAGRVDEPEGA